MAGVMATATTPIPTPADADLLVGEMVHYRVEQQCWAAAIVGSGPEESAQLFLLPLPPSFPMPSAPGTFVRHGAERDDETWHRLTECGVAKPARTKRRARRRSSTD